MSDETNDVQGLEHLLHDRAGDDTVLYAKAREFGPELFPELTLNERKLKLNNEVRNLELFEKFSLRKIYLDFSFTTRN